MDIPEETVLWCILLISLLTVTCQFLSSLEIYIQKKMHFHEKLVSVTETLKNEKNFRRTYSVLIDKYVMTNSLKSAENLLVKKTMSSQDEQKTCALNECKLLDPLSRVYFTFMFRYFQNTIFCSCIMNNIINVLKMNLFPGNLAYEAGKKLKTNIQFIETQSKHISERELVEKVSTLCLYIKSILNGKSDEGITVNTSLDKTPFTMSSEIGNETPPEEKINCDIEYRENIQNNEDKKITIDENEDNQVTKSKFLDCNFEEEKFNNQDSVTENETQHLSSSTNVQGNRSYLKKPYTKDIKNKTISLLPKRNLLRKGSISSKASREKEQNGHFIQKSLSRLISQGSRNSMKSLAASVLNTEKLQNACVPQKSRSIMQVASQNSTYCSDLSAAAKPSENRRKIFQNKKLSSQFHLQTKGKKSESNHSKKSTNAEDIKRRLERGYTKLGKN